MEILVSNAEYWCHIGVTPEERARAQRLLVDLSITCRPPAADTIDSTLNYSALNKRLGARLEQECALLETAGRWIVEELLSYSAVERVSVCVKKPGALRNAAYAAIRFEGDRHELLGYELRSH